MESSPLNKAHQLDRRAEALLKLKKFDESIECHKNAMKHLQDALQMTENPRSKESIQLQIDSHHKLVDSLKVKKTQYEEFCKKQNELKQKVNFETMSEDGATVQHEILRAIVTHDSLVEVLMKRNYDDECLKSYTSDDDKSSDTCDGMKISGRKREVDDSTLLEEFKGLSEKLRELVQILVLQLEEKESEISRLKAEIYKLECEKNKEGIKSNNALKVITDSSGGTSPYVFSPCSELSPEVHEIRGLPSLAPLEMPHFDFSSLVKNTNNLNLNSTNN